MPKKRKKPNHITFTRKGIGNALCILGILFIVVPYTFSIINAGTLTSPKALASNEQVQVVNQPDDVQPPQRIVLPALKIDIPVALSPIEDGYWKVYEDKAGFGQGTGYPGRPGNQVIFAHARPGLFKSLPKVTKGDEILVSTNDKTYRYQVVETKTVNPNQIDVVAQTEDETLTLFTCVGFADSKRFIVVAKPI